MFAFNSCCLLIVLLGHRFWSVHSYFVFSNVQVQRSESLESEETFPLGTCATPAAKTKASRGKCGASTP
jgi:hypothetical protein